MSSQLHVQDVQTDSNVKVLVRRGPQSVQLGSTDLPQDLTLVLSDLQEPSQLTEESKMKLNVYHVQKEEFAQRKG